MSLCKTTILCVFIAICAGGGCAIQPSNNAAERGRYVLQQPVLLVRQGGLLEPTWYALVPMGGGGFPEFDGFPATVQDYQRSPDGWKSRGIQGVVPAGTCLQFIQPRTYNPVTGAEAWPGARITDSPFSKRMVQLTYLGGRDGNYLDQKILQPVPIKEP